MARAHTTPALSRQTSEADSKFGKVHADSVVVAIEKLTRLV